MTSQNSTPAAIACIGSGAIAGAGVYNAVGSIGVGIAGTAFGVGSTTFIGAGSVVGAAGYGAYYGLVNQDPFALSSIGVGAIAGAGLSSTVGGIGLVGSFGGIGLGMGTMAAAGGVLGLGLYGLAKLLDQSSSREPIAQVFDRMEAKIAAQEANSMFYVEAMLELMHPEDPFRRYFEALDIGDDLDRLKAEVQRQQKLQVALPSNSQGWQELHTLNHHAGTVNEIAFSPEGQTVLTASDDRTVLQWNVHTGKLFSSFVQSQPVLAIAISPNGETLAAGGVDQMISSWSLNTRLFLKNFSGSGLTSSHSGLVCSISFSKDGKLIASGSADRTIRLWHSAQGVLKRTFNGHTDTIFSVAISSNGNHMASGSADKTIRVWNLNQWTSPQVFIGHTGWVNAVLISPDGNTVISGSSDSTIKLWDLHTGNERQTLTGHSGAIVALAISQDGSTLVSSSNDGTIRIWNLFYHANGDLQGEFRDMLSGSGAIALSPDGNILVNSHKQGVISVWKYHH